MYNKLWEIIRYCKVSKSWTRVRYYNILWHNYKISLYLCVSLSKSRHLASIAIQLSFAAPTSDSSTTPPSGSSTTPRSGSSCAPPSGNSTVPPSGYSTAPPSGSSTSSPSGSSRAPPSSYHHQMPSGVWKWCP